MAELDSLDGISMMKSVNGVGLGPFVLALFGKTCAAVDFFIFSLVMIFRWVDVPRYLGNLSNEERLSSKMSKKCSCSNAYVTSYS